MNMVALLLGRRLANRESQARKIGALEALPAMGLDAPASIAYGPEAALVLLMPLGAAAPTMLGCLLLPIIVLPGVLCLSYRQTIQAYRDRGEACVVARENLGVPAGLIAATALLIDYISNVAVGISAGVAALVSVLPRLHSHSDDPSGREKISAFTARGGTIRYACCRQAACCTAIRANHEFASRAFSSSRDARSTLILP